MDNDKEPTFSLNDFRKWLSIHRGSSQIVLDGQSPNQLLIGDQVLVRLSEANMLSKLAPINPNMSRDQLSRVCSHLREYGGIMQKIAGPYAALKVMGLDGTVVAMVPRLFLRRPKR